MTSNKSALNPAFNSFFFLAMACQWNYCINNQLNTVPTTRRSSGWTPPSSSSSWFSLSLISLSDSRLELPWTEVIELFGNAITSPIQSKYSTAGGRLGKLTLHSHHHWLATIRKIVMIFTSKHTLMDIQREVDFKVVRRSESRVKRTLCSGWCHNLQSHAWLSFCDHFILAHIYTEWVS